MKFFFTLGLCAAGLFATAQTTVTLTEDLVLTETLVITEDVTYQGNGYSIICEGCDPAIYVKEGARVHFANVIFPKNYAKWLRVQGGDMDMVSWDSSRMKGHIRRLND